MKFPLHNYNILCVFQFKWRRIWCRDNTIPKKAQKQFKHICVTFPIFVWNNTGDKFNMGRVGAQNCTGKLPFCHSLWMASMNASLGRIGYCESFTCWALYKSNGSYTSIRSSFTIILTDVASSWCRIIVCSETFLFKLATYCLENRCFLIADSWKACRLALFPISPWIILVMKTLWKYGYSWI